MKSFLLFSLLSLCLCHNLRCQFDILYKQMTSTPPLYASISSTDLPSLSRNLLTVSRSAIRITLDESNFTSVVAGAGTTPTTTTTNLAFLKLAMSTVRQFLQKRVRVVPMAKVFSVPFCVDFAPPANDVTNGISNSDLHIYLQYLTDNTKSYGATGKSCNYYSGSLPDVTLQVGRPIVGRMIFNTHQLVDGQTLTSRLFQSVASTALHQTMHILGFDSTLYNTYLDSNTGNTYSYNPLSSDAGLIHSSRPVTKYLVTPNLVAYTREFFACNNAPGMQVENEDSTGLGSGSHWERTVAYDELMTGTAFGAQKGMSAFTWALLKDTGWYTVDDTFNETNNYGYHVGCSFFYNACYGTSFPNYFCSSTTQSGISYCATNFYEKAVCSSAASIMADGCGIYGPYFNCVDPASSDDGYKAYTFQQYGTNSFCVASTLSSIAISSASQSRCYPYVCQASSIVFTIGTYSITCLSTDAGMVKTLSALTGGLTCPVFADFCTNARKVCPNWCSQNGYCMGGTCNCNAGYSGVDCSKVICSSTTYYNPVTNTCGTSCPSHYFVDVYSRSCQVCAAQCGECRDEPQICTGCISTPQNPQYFYNGMCYSQCPANTYLSLDTCYVCSSVDNCNTCSLSASNCTSCTSSLFLSAPTFGTCVSTCTGLNVLKDLVNYRCVSTCSNNLVLSGSTCVLCAPSTYKLISTSSCIGTCPDQYYGNVQLRLCSQCDGSCLNCNGPYAENCTKCKPSSPNKYILFSLCLAICPKGTYANDTAGACELCTIGLNCVSCTIANGGVVCTSCQFGYYLYNRACVSLCNPGFYPNSWNNSCTGCNGACLTCNGPSSTNCVTCASNLFFINNITGSYCVSACPTIGFVTASTNCLSCDQTCYTCNGVASSQCASCVGAYYLSNGYCRYVCPSTKYPNNNTHVCQPCNGLCSFCFGPTVNNCTACVSGKVLYNFTCMGSCPNGLAVNQWNVCYQWVLSLMVGVMIALFV